MSRSVKSKEAAGLRIKRRGVNPHPKQFCIDAIAQDRERGISPLWAARLDKARDVRMSRRQGG